MFLKEVNFCISVKNKCWYNVDTYFIKKNRTTDILNACGTDPGLIAESQLI